MEIEVIRNDRDHQPAMKEIDRLWPPSGAPKAGTAEADRLELLGILVDAYERKSRLLLLIVLHRWLPRAIVP